MPKKKINVDGYEISVLTGKEDNYVSLVDIIKQKHIDPKIILQNWIRGRATIEYLMEWESVHNDEFNRPEAEKIYNTPHLASVREWVDNTNPIGIQITRDNIYAHKEVAINFCYWLSPSFQVYLIKVFNKIQEEEAKKLNSNWNVSRLLTKVNYKIHTEAVRQYLIPPKVQYTKYEGNFFADEADLINLALFGTTARQWRIENPTLNGNMRDHASTEQLLVLSNLQSLNASLLEWGSDHTQRLELLNKAAIDQMSILVGSKSLEKLDKIRKVGAKKKVVKKIGKKKI